LREHSILNCCGVVITTNFRTDGIYLPADDRRHFVAWTGLSKDDFKSDYWSAIWNWYREGGERDVAAYLAALDLSNFNAKAPPRKTAAFWDIVDANRAPEDAELADLLDNLGNPDAVTLGRIMNSATGSFADWIGDRKNRRVIPNRLESCGYTPIRNDAAQDGLWKVSNRRQVIYAKAELSLAEQLGAAQQITGTDQCSQ
jgi:hypothetical protein